MIKHSSPIQKEAVAAGLESGDLDEAMETLNALQSVPYTINSKVIDLLDFIVKSRLTEQVEGFPSFVKTPWKNPFTGDGTKFKVNKKDKIDEVQDYVEAHWPDDEDEQRSQKAGYWADWNETLIGNREVVANMINVKDTFPKPKN